jgi:hypothetical protein
VTLGRLRSVMRTSSMGGLRWGPTASSRPINRTACIQHGTCRGVRPILSNYGPRGRSYGGKATQLGGLCRYCQQKRGSDSRGRLSTRAFLTVRGRSAIVCDYRTALFLIQQQARDSPNTYLMMGFSYLAAVVEAVRMWEAFFAFQICIACFLFRILGNTWVSPRIPDRRKLLLLRVRCQVSASIPSTTLGGMECHNSSGAQHRAYCGTNDCVTGIGKCGRKDVLRSGNPPIWCLNDGLRLRLLLNPRAMQLCGPPHRQFGRASARHQRWCEWWVGNGPRMVSYHA